MINTMNDDYSNLLGKQYQPNTPIFILPSGPIFIEQFYQTIAEHTQKLQLHTAQRWALCFSDAYQFTIALLAVLAAKKQPILLPNKQPGTLALLQTEYDAILSDNDEIPSTVLPNPINLRLEKLDIDPTATLILFTSGSSGQHKKVQRSVAALMREIHILESQFSAYMQEAVIFASVSHQHMYGLIFHILWPLMYGRSICSTVSTFPEEIVKIIKQYQKIIFVSSPSLLSRFKLSQFTTQKVTIFSSGSLLPTAAAEYWYQHYQLQPYEILGSTETGAVAYRQQISNPYWQPFSEVRISQDQVTLCLQVSSPFFDEEHPILMGDTVQIEKNNQFILRERIDRIVKIEGKRISLDEIEMLLTQHKYVKESFVGMVTTQFRQMLFAIIVLTPAGNEKIAQQGKKLLNQMFRQWLQQYVEAIALPKKFRYINNLTVNAQGKIRQEDIYALLEGDNL